MKTKTLSSKQTHDISDNIKGVLKGVKGYDDKDVNISVNLTKRRVNVEKFVMLFQEATRMLVEKRISPSTLGLLVYFLSKMEYSNHIGIDQKTMASDLSLNVKTINRAIKEMKMAKMIVDYKDPQDRKRNVYIVNPYIAWKGTIKERVKITKEINPDQLRLF